MCLKRENPPEKWWLRRDNFGKTRRNSPIGILDQGAQVFQDLAIAELSAVHIDVHTAKFWKRAAV